MKNLDEYINDQIDRQEQRRDAIEDNIVDQQSQQQIE